MLRSIQVLLTFCLIIIGKTGFSQDSYYPINPVPFTDVTIKDAFWKERIETNREVTIPIAFQRSEETGRIKNFKVAGGLEEGTFNTRRGYDDSDVFKVMEGAAYALAEHPDPELEAYLDKLIYYVGEAQEEDGYLYTVKTILGDSEEHRDSKARRWEAIEQGSHELYNVGHMYEAAVAHFEATGKRSFLDIAIKNADLVDKEFGWGKREVVPGHQEIEVGLVKLYNATGEKRYLNLAKFFLDKRGENEHKTTYNQSHKKVTEQDEAVGHSVRAVYMYAGMADIAALTGDVAYVEAMDNLWHDIVDAKLYIIGGIGAAGGHEGFGGEYELPNLRAYNETCAAIANVFWNYRLFLMHGDAKYVDVLERSLYNNVLSGVSLGGDEFFYPNRMEARGKTQRSEWFNTSCCPSNVARYLPAVPGYIYAQDEEKLYVNLFISSQSEFDIKGQKVRVEQSSQIPWSGQVELKINSDNTTRFPLHIRIPGWASERPVPSDLYSFTAGPSRKTIIRVNGKAVEYTMEKGYAVVEQSWKKGDLVQIDFPYEVRTIQSHSEIPTNQNRIALQAGPVVFCVESVDNLGYATNLLLDGKQDFQLVYEKDLLGGVMTIHGQADALLENAKGKIDKQSIPFKAIPYYAWANRGASDMLVWIPAEEKAAAPRPYPSLASRSKVATSKDRRAGALHAVNDLIKPNNNPTLEVTNFNWWPIKESTGWITYEFPEEAEISESTVYWFKSNDGGVIYPLSWKLYYQKNGDWVPVKVSSYPVNEDGKPSRVSFPKVKTKAMKLELVNGEKSAGLYEWEVK